MEDGSSQPVSATTGCLSPNGGGLSLIFTTLCIIDLFGVFPVMTLPRPIIECGWLGLPIALSVFGLQIYTAVLLGRCWVIAENIDPNIIRKTSQNLQLLGLMLSASSVNISYCYWLIILGIILCPIMWLGSPKDMKWVAVISVGSVFGVALLTWANMMTDPNPPAVVHIPKPSWESFAIAYGILAFQFDIHPMVLTVQVDMRNKADLGKAIVWSFIVTGGLFLVSTSIAMIKYGTAIRYNMLQTFPANGLLYLDLLLVTVQICLSMVVGGSALFQDIEDRLGVPREFNWKRCASRSSLLFFMVVIGEFVPRFDLIMGLIGGALTGPLMFVFPPLLYIRYRYLQAQNQTKSPQSALIDEIILSRDNTSAENNPYYKIYYDETESVSHDDEYNEHSEFDGEFDSMEFSGHYCSTPMVRNYGSIEIRHAGRGNIIARRLLNLIKKYLLSIQGPTDKYPITKFESFLIMCIIVLGMLATCGATFYSVRGAILYAKFTPACFP
ncbi:hypothetical protein C0J52_23519 [Blattella germanica]|nr:hypothetical protein C0J52_23519 [Blattella germanica]